MQVTAAMREREPEEHPARRRVEERVFSPRKYGSATEAIAARGRGGGLGVEPRVGVLARPRSRAHSAASHFTGGPLVPAMQPFGRKSPGTSWWSMYGRGSGQTGAKAEEDVARPARS